MLLNALSLNACAEILYAEPPAVTSKSILLIFIGNTRLPNAPTLCGFPLSSNPLKSIIRAYGAFK